MSAAVRLALFAVLALAASSGVAGVAATKHNLSVTGPGTVKAAAESEICVFCHAPHNAAPSGPLWNRRTPGSTYIPYASSTLKSVPGQPTGASLMCLSCHDGTIALGDMLTRPGTQMTGGVSTMPAGPTRLGTDLSDDHPVSFTYDAALATARGELASPGSLVAPNAVRLDSSGRLQCTACHNPHSDALPKFLVKSNVASALCLTCHLKAYWSGSDHRNSTAAYGGSTVAANACGSCHRPHGAGGKPRLLKLASEEGNCYPCHNGAVAPKNIQSEFAKASVHPVASYTAVHDPAEPAVVQSRHVECADCHNPHAAKAGPDTPSGPLAGVRGININGTEVRPAAYEYEICLRCHADSPGKPAPRTPRQIAQNNVRLEFNTGNPSHHAVAGPGRSTNVPSLIAPWTTGSILKCTDCHANNAGPGAGGTGPKGPHGSTYAPLLERQYVTTDSSSESAANYALCYKCHSRTSILADQSFREHSRHISRVRAPCNVCHDAHGISATQGSAVNNSRLINFDTSVVKPTSSGALRFESQGTNRGRCYLVCHWRTHNPLSY